MGEIFGLDKHIFALIFLAHMGIGVFLARMGVGVFEQDNFARMGVGVLKKLAPHHPHMLVFYFPFFRIKQNLFVVTNKITCVQIFIIFLFRGLGACKITDNGGLI